MAKTYLQLVNEVLKRVREPQVGTVSAGLYSALISTFVNDAKRVVEDAWMWSSLRHTVDFDLAASTREYDLSSTALVGAGNELTERSVLLDDPQSKCVMAFDVTSGNQTPLIEVTHHRVLREIALDTNPTPQAYPLFFSVRPTADSVFINLFELPEGVRNWRMVFKRPQEDLVDGTDEIKVPWLPVVLLATNYALSEKGEEVGQPGNEAEKRYYQSLADAIALDSRYSDQLTTFYEA